MDSFNPVRGLSKQKKAFFDHQKHSRKLERERLKAFSKYKRKYKAYQQKQKEVLSLRLKTLSFSRKKTTKEIPVF